MTPSKSPSPTERASQRLGRAISSLIQRQPFVGITAMHLIPPLPNPGLHSLAADGLKLHYNPRWVNEATSQQILHAIAHCVLACALKHHTRRGDRSHNRWQQASRQVTQYILLEQDLADPKHGPGMDLSVIQAYTRLPPDRTEPPAQTQPDPQANESPDAGTDLAENLQDPQPQGQEPQDHHQDTSGPPPQQNPTDHEPDGTQDQDHGQHQDQENAGQQPGDPMEQRGAVLDHPSSQEDTDDSSEELRWDYITHQAITMAERQGKTPGRLEELISRSHAPSLDWRAHLREFMTEFAPSESSWSHPSRRFIARGLYLPGPHADSITSICFAIDTSNSLQTEDLARAWNEIREAADALEPESLRIIQCDAALQDDHTYDGYHLPQELAAKGRRGTDYRPVFETLETEPPAFLIYLTDLECSKYPPVTPNYPVLWICTDPTSQRQPPFGDRIDLPPVS